MQTVSERIGNSLKEFADALEKENDDLESRPLPDAFRALEEIAQAILESRVSIETTMTVFQDEWTVKNKIVVDPPKK